MCIGNTNTVPIPRMCKKLTAVSVSSAESENNFFGRQFENGSFTSIAILLLKLLRILTLRETLLAQLASVTHHLIPLITCPLIWFTTFPATSQRVHSQPDSFSKTARPSFV